MAAGHPKTRGKLCTKEHPNYVYGWSFADSSRKSTEYNTFLNGPSQRSKAEELIAKYQMK